MSVPLLMLAAGAVAAEPELLERLRQLEANQAKLAEQNAELYRRLKEKDDRLDALEAELERTKKATRAGAAPAAAKRAPSKAAPVATAPAPSAAAAPVAAAPAPAESPPAVSAAAEVPTSDPDLVTTSAPAPPEGTPVPRERGAYQQGRGFSLARNEWGEVNFGIYTYLRYLNQHLLDDTYVNGLGDTVRLDHRNDLELNKVKIEFRGWLIDPHFRYTL